MAASSSKKHPSSTEKTDAHAVNLDEEAQLPIDAKGQLDQNSDLDDPPVEKNGNTEVAASEAQTSQKDEEDEETDSNNPPPEKTESQPPAATEWQAVWSPPYNAYYFFNSRTQETTWTNPLEPQSHSKPAEPASSNDDTPGASSSNPSQANEAVLPTGQLIDTAALNGIDPALAHLDPTLYATKQPLGTPGQSFTAKFNARTGKFSTDARDPSHLSEAERAKRMSSVYFDVERWEGEVAARKVAEEESAAAGEKRKRPTKQDLERFKEQKKQKKIAKQAWLRN